MVVTDRLHRVFALLIIAAALSTSCTSAYRTDDSSEASDADAASVMPDLIGQALDDSEQQLDQLHSAAQTFGIHYLPSDDADIGTIVNESPAVGEQVAGSHVVISVSEGGPVSTVAQLPSAIADVFRRSGLAPDTLVKVIETKDGALYKTDQLLVAENCVLLSQASYDSIDPKFGRACAGQG
ncbi:MAG: PASTA domain-containing protein [Acidimicrobiia bacterium]|nr:PASTA domain-containing protein [Acidimicrobiia bacterium]